MPESQQGRHFLARASQAAEKSAFWVEPAFRPASKSFIFIIPNGLLAREESAFLIFSAASSARAIPTPPSAFHPLSTQLPPFHTIPTLFNLRVLPASVVKISRRDFKLAT